MNVSWIRLLKLWLPEEAKRHRFAGGCAGCVALSCLHVDETGLADEMGLAVLVDPVEIVGDVAATAADAIC